MRRGRGSTRPPLLAVLAVLLVVGAVPAGMMAWPSDDPAAAPPVAAVASPLDEARARSAMANLPLSFEANQGQDDPQVAFTSRGAGYDLFLTPTEAIFALPGQTEEGPGEGGGSALRMGLVGANPDPVMNGKEPLAGKVNYLRGNDPGQWQTDVPTYGQVAYDSVYPGVDLLYYGKGQELEYDFVVAPGADPGPIEMRFSGADDMTLDPNGDLVLATAAGDVRQRRPEIYQEIAGARRPVAGSFVLGAGGSVRFDVGAYDTSLPLVIDPVVEYSAYIGFGRVIIRAVAVDETGIYVAGQAGEEGFPLDGEDAFKGGTADVFLAKLNSEGTALIYATHLGSTAFPEERASSLAVHAGNAYLAGDAGGPDFPIKGGYATTCRASEAFVSKVDAGGNLMYSTCIPGGIEQSFDLAVDGDGDVYVTGNAGEAFASTAEAQGGSPPNGGSDVFIVRIDPDLVGEASLIFATHFGGSGADAAGGIAVDPTSENEVWITGRTESPDLATDGASLRDGGDCSNRFGCGDAYIARVDTSVDGPGALKYATYYGGVDLDGGTSIAVGDDGDVYIAGRTGSNDLIGTDDGFQPFLASQSPRPNFDSFLVKLSERGSVVTYATYLGGSGTESNAKIALGAEQNVFMVAATDSEDLVGKEAFQPLAGGGDLVVVEVDMSADVPDSLRFLSYLGGSGSDGNFFGVTVGPEQNLYIGTYTESSDYPTTQGDSFGSPGGPYRSLLVVVSPQPVFQVDDGLDPDRGPSGTVVTITGNGFTQETKVLFGDNLGTEVNVAKEGTSLTVKSPPRMGGALGPIVTVAIPDQDPQSPGSYLYLEPAISAVEVATACGFGDRAVVIRGTNLDLVDEVRFDRELRPHTPVDAFEIRATFVEDPSGEVEVEVRSVDATASFGPVSYEPCDAGGGGDEPPPDPIDPPPPPPGEGNSPPPPTGVGGGGGGFTNVPVPGSAPGSGFTTAPGASPPAGGFTNAPAASPPAGGFSTAPGAASVPGGGFTTAPGVSSAPSGGFSTAPGAVGAPTGVAVPGSSPTPGGSTAPSPGGVTPSPTPAAAPGAPVVGSAQPGAPAFGSGPNDESSPGAASRYSMVAAERSGGVPPVAWAGTALVMFFGFALLTTRQSPRPGWQFGAGASSRPRSRGAY